MPVPQRITHVNDGARRAPSILRKTVAPAAMLAASVLVLTGCGPDIGAESASAVLSAPTSDSPSGEITIWDRSGDLFNVFDGVIEKFNEKYPDITVNHEAVDIDAKLPNTLITATDVPDGVFLDDAKVAGFADQLYDLSDVLTPYLEDIAPQKVDVNSVDGNVYGVPWDLNPGPLFYRADILQAAGVDPESIETYDDLTDAAQKVKDANPDAGPIHLEQSAFLGQLWLEMFASQQGASLADENGELQLDSPEYLKILTWLDDVNNSTT
ncbi:ABC transporter substrate-binding protein [Glaciibacter superstes]|uniref:ABC transporter substrate-binding protein n=1 Tax=Glaciibacter superstes TaxID=501023 RepID=UPI000418B9F8|nr:extracellular solute-binding protein [Glaciibacter superstes]